jgi:hypothetical protein
VTIVDKMGKLPHKEWATYPFRSLTQIQRVVMHHTAGPSTETPEQIAQYHVDVKGWPGIGYHYVIIPAGAVFKCLPATVVSNCVAGGNTTSLCVALVGNFDLGPVPDAQWAAAVELAKELVAAYNLKEVYGHREVPGPPQDTHCPGLYFVTDKFRAEVFGNGNSNPSS